MNIEPLEALAAVYAHMGVIFNRSKRFSHAEKTLQKAIALNAKPLGPHFALAEACEGLNQFQKAEKEYRLILALAPQHSEALTRIRRLTKAK